MAIQINGDSGISGVNGSAGTPALQGTDSNTGIVFGTDTVQISTGGSTRVTVDSSGNVTTTGKIEIGTVTDLNADGTATFNGLITNNEAFRANRAGSGQACFSARHNNTENVLISADGSAEFAGNVQVGGNPISGSANGSVALSDSGFIAANSNAAVPLWRGYTTGNSTQTSSILADGSATFSGTVVTGNTSGNNNFTVTNGTTILKRDAAVSNDLLLLGNASTTYGKVRINAAAFFTQVNIGTQGSWDKIALNEDGSATFNSFIAVNRTGSTDACFHSRLNGSNTSVIRANGSADFAGDVRVELGEQLRFGTSSNTDYGKITANGSQQLTAFAGLGNTTNGVLLSSGATSWSSASSESRLKNILGDVDVVQAWDLVRDMRLTRYQYKDATELAVSYAGPMADWLGQQDPELLIDTGKSDDVGPIHTYNQGLLDMKALAALSTALKRIETLETQNASLEARLTILEGAS